MTLLDVLQLVDENRNTYIECNGEIVALYDGRNSTDEALNDNEVIRISADGNSVIIEIAIEE